MRAVVEQYLGGFGEYVRVGSARLAVCRVGGAGNVDIVAQSQCHLVLIFSFGHAPYARRVIRRAPPAVRDHARHHAGTVHYYHLVR